MKSFSDTDEALAYVEQKNRPKGDFILIKGSRGNRLERLVPGLELL